MLKFIFIFFFGLMASIASMIFLRKISLSSKVLLSKDVVLIGGLGIAGAFAASSFLGLAWFGIPWESTIRLIAVCFVVLLFGIADDIRELSVTEKFLWQILSAALLISIGVRTQIVYLDFGGNLFVTLFWILGIMNAFNLLDIMDGVSGGTALIVVGALVVVSGLHAQLSIQILSLALAGAISGFLFFNFPPAKIYLGNAGSHFLGFVLAALTLMISYATIERSVALLSPVVILWLPILETALLVYFRLNKKILPFNKSKDHIALRLLALGFTRQNALFLMMCSAAFFALCGIIMSQANNFLGSIIVSIVILVSLCLFLMIKKAEVHG